MAPPNRRGRPARRGPGARVIGLIVVLLVLLGLVVAADRLAIGQAESIVARNLRTHAGFAAEPAVTIHGFPFLTQLARNRFDRVDVDGRGMAAGTAERPLDVDRLVLRLRDVETSDNYRTIVAGSLDGTAFVTWAEIGRQFGAPVVPQGDGRLHLDVTADLYGQQAPIAVSVRPVLDSPTQRVALTEPEVIVGQYRIPDAVVQRIAADRAPPVELSLPLSLRAESLTLTPEHLELGASGNDVRLTG